MGLRRREPRATDAFVAQAIEDARRHVAEHGVHLQFVGGAPDRLPFTYTAGLAPLGPELWLSALAPDTSTEVLNLLAAKVRTWGLVPLDGLVVAPGGDVAVPMKLREVAVTPAHAALAWILYPREHRAVVQVLWPDTSGRYPDEDEYDQRRFPQELLARPAHWRGSR